MYNAHYIVIRANSPEQACSDAESETEGWGSEDNFRSMCGCIDEDEKIYKTKEGRWDVPKTLKQISNEIKHAADRYEYSSLLPPAIARFKVDEDTMSSMDWWTLGDYCQFKMEQYNFNHKDYNIWENEYQSWQLNKFGITNMIKKGDEGKKKYIVVVDMHS